MYRLMFEKLVDIVQSQNIELMLFCILLISCFLGTILLWWIRETNKTKNENEIFKISVFGIPNSGKSGFTKELIHSLAESNFYISKSRNFTLGYQIKYLKAKQNLLKNQKIEIAEFDYELGKKILKEKKGINKKTRGFLSETDYLFFIINLNSSLRRQKNYFMELKKSLEIDTTHIILTHVDKKRIRKPSSYIRQRWRSVILGDTITPTNPRLFAIWKHTSNVDLKEKETTLNLYQIRRYLLDSLLKRVKGSIKYG